MGDAMQRFACIPTYSSDAFFKQKEKLEKKVKERNIENVVFKGEIQEFADFKSFDIFILLSESEGLPMSALEAMSAGLPLILSNVGGCPELIEDNGVLVENHSFDVIKGIKKVINDIDYYSSNSKKKYDEHFNLINKQKEYFDFYSN
jgi:glycosyltransferase involved in cell wall biosynthesis